MAGMIKVNTDQVAAIAANIESLNVDLKQLIIDSNVSMQNLSNTWTGEAATKTLENYNSFSKKYSEEYYAVIDQYVKFLKTNVDAGYVAVETGNSSLADSFK